MPNPETGRIQSSGTTRRPLRPFRADPFAMWQRAPPASAAVSITCASPTIGFEAPPCNVAVAPTCHGRSLGHCPPGGQTAAPASGPSQTDGRRGNCLPCRDKLSKGWGGGEGGVTNTLILHRIALPLPVTIPAKKLDCALFPYLLPLGDSVTEPKVEVGPFCLLVIQPIIRSSCAWHRIEGGFE